MTNGVALSAGPFTEPLKDVLAALGGQTCHWDRISPHCCCNSMADLVSVSASVLDFAGFTKGPPSAAHRSGTVEPVSAPGLPASSKSLDQCLGQLENIFKAIPAGCQPLQEEGWNWLLQDVPERTLMAKCQWLPPAMEPVDLHYVGGLTSTFVSSTPMLHGSMSLPMDDKATPLLWSEISLVSGRPGPL